MRAGWLARTGAAAAIAMMSLTAAATIGEGAAQASPTGHAAAAISTGRAVSASACTGRKVILTSWKPGKTSYKPGQEVVVRGNAENCTTKTVGISFRSTIVAPCARDTVPASKGRLDAHKSVGIRTSDSSLPSRLNGKSCAGTWKVSATIWSGGKSLATRTTSFRLS